MNSVGVFPENVPQGLYLWSFYKERREHCDLLKEKHLVNTYTLYNTCMYYVITVAITQFVSARFVINWGYHCEVRYMLSTTIITSYIMQCSLQNSQLKKFPLKTFNMIKIYELFCSADLVEIPKQLCLSQEDTCRKMEVLQVSVISNKRIPE